MLYLWTCRNPIESESDDINPRPVDDDDEVSFIIAPGLSARLHAI